jgi:hypothetical protein
MPRSVRVIALDALLVVTACGQATALPPVYPNPGFGRLGCFVSTRLAMIPGTHLDSLSRPATTDPAIRSWLVLDSLSPRETERFAYSPSRGATLLYRLGSRKDSVLAAGATWQPAGRDSLLVKDWGIAETTWYLGRRGGDLRGVGVMVHDMRERMPDGTTRFAESKWTVWLVPVPCSSVPLEVLVPK